jgi:transcriptional regulator with GAF, ATPase, and Fis domain
LIRGERGTGKELVARAIHDEGEPADRPFVVVNCAAFPDTLLESELFGYERGAFTGADSMRQGKFEQARLGTLFLDEIGYMSISFQKKILRTVEYGTFNRVGGSEEIRSTARIIAATNANLTEKMGNGEFLPDLYDRLAFEVISVPPLRDREGDIELLAREFLSRFMAEIPGFRGKTLSRSALQALRDYDFPGNVRELKNIIERAAYRDTTNEITPEDIDLPRMTRSRSGGTFTAQVEGFKKALILDALEKTGGNQAEAARRLGMSYHQFRHYHRKVVAASRA